ncbi:MAG: LCP family protein [Corynebacterium sp.]|nr:LCP family protein [Corynebacterium sp.]
MGSKTRRNRVIQAAPSHGPDTHQQGPTTIKALVSFMSALVLVISGVGYFAIGRVQDNIASAGSLDLGGNGMTEALDGAIDILMVGNDSRTDAQGNPLTPEEIDLLHAGDEEADNTDTIMVIRIPNDGKSATAISIPRDTYVHDSEAGNTKINGVYSAHKAAEKDKLLAAGETDGPKLEEQVKDSGRKGLIHAVESLSGITIDHYAEVGLLGFVLLTDAVGGVEVCLKAATQDEYSGADFKAGTQTLDGARGLAFVRQRHGLPRGDLDRIVRQQAYMASLVAKVLSTGTLTSPSKLSDLGKAVTRSVTIDKDWDVMQLAAHMQNLAGGNVKFNTIPVTSIDGIGDNGESVVTIDPREVRKFFEQLLGGEAPTAKPPAPTGTSSQEKPINPNKQVMVLNASTVTGLAANVAESLKGMGYQISETGNAPEGMYAQSQVMAANAADPDALALAERLGGLPVLASPSLDNTTLTVITGPDYSGPTNAGAGEEKSEEAASTTSQIVGQEGSALEEEQRSPVLDAGASPRCIN